MRHSPARGGLISGSQLRDAQWRVPVFVALLSAGSAGLSALLLRGSSVPESGQIWLALLCAVLMALAWRFPLPLVEKTKFHLESAVLIAVVMLFPGGIAMLVVGGGTLLGQIVARAEWDQVAFNSGQAMLQAAAGAGILAAAGWQAGDERLDTIVVLMMALIIGAVISAVNLVAVTGVISIQTWSKPKAVLFRTVRGLGVTGAVMLAVQVVLGVVAIETAVAAPWAVGLLVVPGAAIYAVLLHNNRLRDELATAMREREMSLAEVERIARFGSWEWRLDTQEHVWSDELYRIVGLEPGNGLVPSLSFLQFAHPADHAMLEELTHDAVRCGSSLDIEHRVLRADGIERVVHTHADVICESPGEPIRVIGTMHDITERKVLETQLLERVAHSPLTSREHEVLSCLARGNSNKEIAAQLGISEQTVKNHVAAIMRKLRVNDRTQAVVAALKLGWIQLDDGSGENTADLIH